MEQKELLLEANSNLSLIDTLEMQQGTEIIFKARGRDRVPQKILRVHQSFCLKQPNRKPIHLSEGDYIAAYKTPQTKENGCYYLAPLSEKELRIINNILKELYGSSLKKEKVLNHPVSIDDLPVLPIQNETFRALEVNSKITYASDGKSKTGLACIIRLNKDLSFWVVKNKKYTYKASKNDYFLVISKKSKKKDLIYLTPIPKEDVPAIKAQDKKERISRKYQANKFLKLTEVFHTPNIKNTHKQKVKD